MPGLEQYFGADGTLSKVFARYEPRAAQLAMAEAVAKALAKTEHLLVEAGTGTGKTLAYLLPAALADKTVVVSTGTKALQDQLVTKDIPLLRKALGRNVQAAVLKGRNNYLCTYRYGRFAFQGNILDDKENALFEIINEWADTTETGERSELEAMPDNFPHWRMMSATPENCLGSKCPEYEGCFYFKAKQQASEAEIIIVNHHLYFADVSVRESTAANAAILPEHDIVIFDEAHMLEDVATQHLGTAISTAPIGDLTQDVAMEMQVAKLSGGSLGTFVNEVNLRSEAFFAHFRGSDTKARLRQEHWTEEVKKRHQELLNAFRGLYRGLSNLKDAEAKQKLKERANLLASAIAFMEGFNEPDYAYMCESFGRSTALQAYPIQVASAFAGQVLAQRESVVLASATLSTGKENFAFIRSRLGVGKVDTLQLDSPFDYQRQALLYVPEHMPLPDEEEYALKAARELYWIATQTKGRALFLFTSYRMLDFVHGKLHEHLEYPLLIQGDAPKGTLLRQFRKEVSSVLLATASFWQGVDVPGEALSAVAIDKIPFASPGDPLVSARIDHLKEQGRNAFVEYQLPMAMLTLKQGIGRLIRQRDDRGLLAILDARLHRRGYGKQFLSSLPPMRRLTRREEVKKWLPETLGESA